METRVTDLYRQAKGEDRILTLSNVCSAVRILLVPFVIYYIIVQGDGVNHPVLWLLVAAFFLDLFDGYWARSRREITRLGKILDPMADKLLVNAIIITLVIYRSFPLWFAGVVLFRDMSFIIFAYTMFRGKDIVLTSNKLGKTSAFFLALLVLLTAVFGKLPGFERYYQILLGICLALLFGSAINYLNRFIVEINSNKINGADHGGKS